MPIEENHPMLGEERIGFDEAAADELRLYIDNDGDLYRQLTQPIMKNLMKKIDKGTYEHDLGVKAFMHLVDAGAKKYVKEFGSPHDKWHEMFPQDVRWEVARELAMTFLDEAELGNYDQYLR